LEAKQKYIEFFRHTDGLCPVETWLDTLPNEIHATVLKRLDRLEQGSLGDWKPMGEGVIELRIHAGPGYRVYIGTRADHVIVLNGCDKSEQRRTIPVAKSLWKEYKQRIA